MQITESERYNKYRLVLELNFDYGTLLFPKKSPTIKEKVRLSNWLFHGNNKGSNKENEQ